MTALFHGRPDRRLIMSGLLALSLGMHALFLARAPHWFAAVETGVVEFEIREPLPEGRIIPRPRIRHQEVFPAAALPSAPAQIPVPATEAVPHIPKVSALPAVSPVPMPADLPGPAVPVQPAALAAQGPVTAAVAPSPAGQFLTRKDYFDMLRLKIETHKKYPPKARAKFIEGRVGLQFKINPDGSISDLAVIRPARHNSLNRAAVRAVEASAPFTRLPGQLFTEPVEVRITLVFELA